MKKKEVKLTRNEATVLNQVLAGVKVTGMNVDTRRKLICIKIDLGKLAKSGEEFQKETIDSHKPENFETLQSDKTEEGKKNFDVLSIEIDAKVREILNPYYEEEISISFDPITDEEFDKISEVNDLTLAAYEFINEKLMQ